MIPSDHWYKDAVIYTLDVQKFQDASGDGVGDFQGLTKRLDYLAGLGVTCLWLLPFYPSPERDNGYDVTDYYSVNPRYGTLGHFVECMREARERGIRVIIDLVVNHTSNEHPWFQAARSDPQSPYRDWYVWDDDPPHGGEHVAFPGEQENVWTYDEQAGAHYLHHFYSFQPDLNVDNPAVREEIMRIMGFWLELGVSGFRVDAAPFLIEDTTLRAAHAGGGEEPRYEFLRDIREFLDRRRGDAVLLAEANVPLDRLPKYFQSGDQFQMLFGFILNQHLFLALAREQAEPLARGLRSLPELPPVCQWANFIRHHDELTLDSLSEDELQAVFAAFAPRPEMQIFGRGIRRRLPPMVDGDPRRLRLAYSLLLTLPGTPVIRYGEEIGMGDDLAQPGRESVRTAMQWTDAHNAGFSAAPPEQLDCPLIRGGPFGFEQVNVTSQQADPDSLLGWFERAIRTRKRCPEFGRDPWHIIESDHPNVFAHSAGGPAGTVLAVHNLAGRACTARIDFARFRKELLIDLLGDRQYRPVAEASDAVELEPYGFRWFRLDDERELTL